MVYHFFRPLGTWLPQGSQVPNGNLVDRNYRNNNALAMLGTRSNEQHIRCAVTTTSITWPPDVIASGVANLFTIDQPLSELGWNSFQRLIESKHRCAVTRDQFFLPTRVTADAHHKNADV